MQPLRRWLLSCHRHRTDRTAPAERRNTRNGRSHGTRHRRDRRKPAPAPSVRPPCRHTSSQPMPRLPHCVPTCRAQDSRPGREHKHRRKRYSIRQQIIGLPIRFGTKTQHICRPRRNNMEKDLQIKIKVLFLRPNNVSALLRT